MAADFRAFLLQTDRPLQVLESSGPQIGESMVPLAGRQELVESPYGSVRVRGCVGSEADAFDTLTFKGSGPAAVLLLLTESPYEMTSLKYSVFLIHPPSSCQPI